MTFEEKARSMRMSEIVTAMVEGLEKPAIKIDMNYFGVVRTVSSFFGLLKKETCFGCAATNIICKISNKVFTKGNIRTTSTRADFIDSEDSFLILFESAIDELRKGNINNYNVQALKIKIALVPDDVRTLYFRTLPILRTDYTKEHLQTYRDFAVSLRKREI